MNQLISRRNMLRKLSLAAAFGALPLPVFASGVQHSSSPPWDEAERIRSRIKIPTFPIQDFRLTDYGGSGDGRFVNTGAFAAAISACSSSGGGRVIVPAGRWLTGPIHLKSNVNLHVSEGAVLLFSQDPDDYLPVVQTWFEGVELMNYSPFIYAFAAENVALTGSGTLDGQADFDVWWSWRGPRSWKGAKSGTTTGWQEGMPYQKASRNQLMDMVARGVPVEDRQFGAGHYIRSSMVEFNRCRNVLVEGLTLRNAAFWSVHPVLCSNVSVRRINIENPVGANADGVDPECCNDVLIEGCRFDTGDDCISLKSGRNQDGRRLNQPCRNIVIADCHFSSERSALSCGSESSGGIQNVFVENVTAGRVFRFFRIKTNRRRGGINEEIHIRIARVDEALENFIEIQVNFSEPLKDDPGELIAQNFIPVVRDLSFTDIVCGSVDRAFYLPGTAETPIENLLMNNVTIESSEKTSVLSHLQNAIARDVRIGSDKFQFS